MHQDVEQTKLVCPYRRRAKRRRAQQVKATRADQRWATDLMHIPVGDRVYSKQFRLVLKENGLEHRRIQPHCPEENGLIERATRTLREGLEGEDPSNYLELRRILARLRWRYNEERLESALGYLPQQEFYRGDPQQRFEERRVKLFQARHRRRERNLGLRQGTLPLEGGEAVTSN